MKRLLGLFLLVTVLVAAIVIAIRMRSRPAVPPPASAPFDPKSAPIAPDMDSIPSDSLWFGQVLEDRRETEAFFRGPESPLEDSDRAGFQGLDFYPPDPSWRRRLRLTPFAVLDSVVILDTKNEERVYERAGRFVFEAGGEPQSLTLYRQKYHNYWFLPFKDATNGSETYEVGRYVEPVELGGGLFLVDFNRAYNPYCAYSHRWACPIPPDENRLTVPVRAGEKSFPRPH